MSHRVVRVFAIFCLLLMVGQAVVLSSSHNAATATNLGTQSATVSATSWPMFRGGPDHSGYNPYETTLKPPLELNWSYTTGEEVWSSPAVVDGVIYFGSFDRNMYAVRANTGALKWSYDTDGAIHSSPAVDNGVVFFGSEDGKVYALEAETGALIWSYPTGGRIVSSPTVVNGVVYIGSMSGKLYALQAASGEVVWSFDTGASNYPSPAVVEDTVFFADEAKLYALEAATGSLLWTTKLGGGSFDSSPAVAAGVVYIWNDPNLCAFNATTGDIIWSYATGSGSPSSPAISQGTVYFASFDHKVYAVNAATGNLKWTYSTGGIIVSSPSVANGIVYIGSNDGKFYGLRAETGDVAWVYDIGQAIQSSPAIAAGAAYVGSMTRKLYAFTPAPTPPVLSPTIAFRPLSLSFSATEGGSNPGSQILGIWDSGGGTLNWSVSDDTPWLTLSPTSGSSTGETDDVSVSVDISGMNAKSYSATITISDPEASNSPQMVPVSLTISPPQETVSTPNSPDGPTSGQVGQSLTYSTGGASSNLGHSTQHRFDWGDGTYSSWSSSTTASHSWSSDGTYTVKAQARCATHTSIVSSWSSEFSVSILSGTGTINEPKWIIVHHTGGTEQDPMASTKHHTFEIVNDWHRKLWPNFESSLGYHIGYHYFIDAQGKVMQGRTETDEGAHTVGKNTESIGICLAGNFDRPNEMPTEAQERTLVELIREIQKRWNISDDKIVPHRKFASKTCYGLNLSDDWVQSLLKKYENAIQQEEPSQPEEVPGKESTQSIIETIQEIIDKILDKIRSFFELE